MTGHRYRRRWRDGWRRRCTACARRVCPDATAAEERWDWWQW